MLGVKIMIYYLAQSMIFFMPFFNVFHYISVRAGGALLTALFISLLFGDKFIALCQRFFRSKAREFTPESHKAKDDTPTLGGLFMIGTMMSTMFLWCNLAAPEAWLFAFILLGFGGIGLADDLCKIWYKKGISARLKFRLQCLISFFIVIIWLYMKKPLSVVCIPFLKAFQPELGWLIVPWAMFVIIGTSNAVNLTDGLDGLAISSLLTNFGVFSIVAYLASHHDFAAYLHIPYMPVSELAVIGSAFIGTCLGFLWFNSHPAQIFMGDVGSLSLGAALACMALFCRQELLLCIAGGLFVLETLSVIGQYVSIKWFKRKLFKMAPIHHHFELLGWPESKITIRFTIISIVLALLALITLKFR